MTTLFFALGLLSAQQPCLHGATVDSAWAAYRRGNWTAAGAAFSRADSLCPGHRGARVGLGFVRLQTGDVAGAETVFRTAVRTDATDADAWYGLGLALRRRSRDRDAVPAFRRALRLAPQYRDAEDQLLALGVDSGLAPPLARPSEPRIPARTAGERFLAWRGEIWDTLYVKGVNLGAARPGRFPSEFPEDDSTYAQWIRLIAEANANVIRLYTIFPPAFYRAFGAWNTAHPERPLWLVHGVWAEPPPRGDYDATAWKAGFRAEMRRVVDVLHGRARIGVRPGHAWGRYDADVADRVLAFIIGREWEPLTIQRFNRLARARRSYRGRFLSMPQGTPAEAWMAEQCDYLAGYEWDTYHAARPIAYTNWPTLDPLHHSTEPTGDEEKRLRRQLGLPPNPRLKEYDNDRESLDATHIQPTADNRGGWFAAFHAYPYYPDFIGLESVYGAARSSLGPSHYFGYLQDLRRHHQGLPLLIAEYGVPSSRGLAHWDPEGFHHGGHDERAMAEIDVRLTREIREAGLAGGILFAWLDEWFKHNWVVIDLERPAERNRLWHNVEDAEQNYGLLGQYAGPVDRPVPGGDPAAWRTLPHVERIGPVTLRAGADEAYLYLALEGPARGRYVVGIDTFRPDRGQVRLPGVQREAAVGMEYALVLDSTNRLLVTPDYNPFLVPRPGQGPTALDRLYRFGATALRRRADGAFEPLWVTTNRFRVTRDGRTFPARGYDRGLLREPADAFRDSASGLIEVRLPWTLLNVTDPSSRTVLLGTREPDRFTVDTTDGFRFALALLPERGTEPLAWSPGGPTFAWPVWQVPRWHERLKPAYFAMQSVWGSW